MLEYLEETDDPRWSGHKLIENTYIIFSSDNGGMEGHHNVVFTDNFPLDKGKIHIREGGIRVPFIISGPRAKSGVVSEVVVNGLDFTQLSWDGPARLILAKQILDGSDLGPLLNKDPHDAGMIMDPSYPNRGHRCSGISQWLLPAVSPSQEWIQAHL